MSTTSGAHTPSTTSASAGNTARQAWVVAPVPRSAIVLGKVMGGATMATLQGLLLLPLAPLVGIPVSAPGLLLAVAAIFAVAFALTALGFLLAWSMESIQGFHGVVNLLLMPLGILSGAFFPVAGAADGLAVVMRLNPVTYGLAALRHALYATPGVEPIDAGLAWAVTLGFAGVAFAAATWAARR